ncbi:MAG: hypothetical protein KAU26_09005, partial [Methylococcales bacterium]|nr:hypothetical protein [Methylococcales bacterium]
MTSIFLMLCITLVNASTTLDENCVINILNRTIQVNKNGGWSMPNIPSQMGKIRARATCVQDGKTISGQSNYFTVIRNGITRVGDITFEALDPIPSALNFSNTSSIVELAAAETFQFTVMALYPDNSIKNITNADSGINYSSSNAGIAAVSENGLVTAVSSGNILLTARKDGALVVKQVRVKSDGDTDGDGLPDSYELANNLDPNDPIDASEDQDGDGLTALEEFKLGTKIHVADSDTDGISDGEETIIGEDGFITNPLLADTDGDGLNDYVEILANSSPTDAKDTNFKAALKSIKASPENISLTFNAVNSEQSEQLSITGLLIDGSSINLTQKSTGTSYNSSDLKIASFSEVDGLVFAGQVGTAVISVENATHKTTVNVTIKTFNPVALSAITIPGYANNVDIAGDYAYVAAGSEGLQIVDVSDRENPKIISSLDTDGTAIDIRVLGNFAYIADGDKGLVIINIIDPLKPVLASTLTTAGIAQDIKVDFQTAYIANGKGGLEIIDVSRPTKPISQAQLSNLGNTKGVDVEGNTVVVVADKALIVIDASDPHNPKQLGKINIGNVKDVAIKGNYAYVAAYDTGYRVVNLTDKTKPIIVSGRRDIVPMDVELTNGFAFFAEQLFPNVVAFFNISDPENTVFQGTIDLSNFGDYAGTGIALDSRYAYITEERGMVSSDYKATGDSKLFIAQYLMVNDNAG